MAVTEMTEEDLKRLEPEKLRQKTSMKTALWVTVVLNVLLWGLFIYLPTGEMLGYAIFAPIISGVLLGIAYKSGKKLNLDLKERKKETIEGEIQLKSSTQFKHSTYYEFVINGKKHPVSSSIYTRFDELESIILERTVHGKTLLSCETVQTNDD